MDADSFIVYIKRDHIYKDIAKVIGLTKDGLGRKIWNRFVGLRAKSYSYLIDNGSEDKKIKRHKTVRHKKKT